jgi:hypothetical protein
LGSIKHLVVLKKRPSKLLTGGKVTAMRAGKVYSHGCPVNTHKKGLSKLLTGGKVTAREPEVTSKRTTHKGL